MLSETEGMVGGETYIRKGDGEAQKVISALPSWAYRSKLNCVQIEGPQIGHAVMLQGGEVEHLAARAKGVKERISTITSYRSNVPNVYDSSYLTNVRPYANLKSLYPEWTQYRLRKLRDEITQYLTKSENEPGLFQQEEVQDLIDQQVEYLQRTSRQMVSPQYQKQILEKYGTAAYYDVSRIWETVQCLTDFEKTASLVDRDRRWMPQSTYWVDLQKSIETIRMGKPLRSTFGTHLWTKTRKYYMGDELLRQGLNEIFLDWLGNSGLWDLYVRCSA